MMKDNRPVAPATPPRVWPLEALIGTFATLGTFALVVWILYNGRDVLMPLAFAIVVAFVLWTAVDWMGRLPLIGATPIWLRHFVVLGIAVFALMAMFLQLRTNIEVLARAVPAYQLNIIDMVERLDLRFGLDELWSGGLSRVLSEQVDLQGFIRGTLFTLTNIGGLVALIFLYTAFLLVEYTGIVAKMRIAFDDEEGVERLLSLGHQVNERIGGYLAIKTLINILLGSASYVALLWLGVDLAGFWAIVIGLLNYVPYLGSAAGVALPSLMALAQTGNLGQTALVVVVLSALQFIIGAVIEPRVIGQRMNLSPLVVLLSLACWFAVWGLPGAALAIPLTVIIVSLLGAFSFTRPFAVMLSNNGRV
ncbi:AI-2E family transporter [Aliigemmobacter aestuarii]|uniref:AI-2E family transporter n=1 Tax=Aliigemmobacter aestuarii TaxID=1445661 RepID=A0A4S3MPH4_9RHOB|nr:AI-2E family transporter [Gemmobacter aestuarii]THD83059.1 AI-2E family transporter [Gemmobacter aestuarii]